MLYRNFRFQIVLRLCLIFSLGYLTLYIGTQTYFWLGSVWLGLAVIFMVINLIRFIERSYRELGQFLVAVEQRDFSNTYELKNNQPVPVSLRPALSTLNNAFRDLRSEKESNFQYLQNIVEHVSVGLLCYDGKEEVRLMNRALKDLFGKPYLHQLNALNAVDPSLYQVVKRLEGGERELLRLEGYGPLAVRATEFKLLEETYRLLSFQNIQEELDQNETESWQKLIRVLTHEIMNSVIPISTLSSVIRELLEDRKEEALNEEEREDLRMGLETIEKRSSGLVNFVKAYKSLTQVYEPQLREVKLQPLFANVQTLLKARLQQEEVQLQMEINPPDMLLEADEELLEQCLINLLLNALDAVQGVPNAHITCQARKNSQGRIEMLIFDNGKGMSPEVLENVFIPFFTTKPQGSGVGLSLTRRILHLHNGNIQVQSKEGHGTRFTLQFA